MTKTSKAITIIAITILAFIGGKHLIDSMYAGRAQQQVEADRALANARALAQ